MEVLSDILAGIRATGSVYFCDFLQPPWELTYENEYRAMFHLVRRGRGQIMIGDETHTLEPGDFVFVAPGGDHGLASGHQDDSQTLLLCGYCQFDALENDMLLRSLPRYVLLQRDELEQWPWLTRTLEHLSAEYMSGAPGSELTVNKLTEVLLVQLLRANFGRSGDIGIIAALRDKRLARALTAIHNHPGQRWTIENAAEESSMSRSGFARRFKEVMRVSFFDYLTRLRMRNARALLATTNLTVSMISEKIGYQSDLSFVKAFKKLHGVTPRAYRQSLRL
jgi:AraC-like DNA-binding protein